MPSYLSGSFFSDFRRICVALTPELRRRMRRVFLRIFVLAFLEILGIFSLSFLALSIVSPERLLAMRPVAQVLSWFPQLGVLTADPRLFALLAAVFVVVLSVTRNSWSVAVNISIARLGNAIALYIGETLFHYYLNSPYIKHISNAGKEVFQALAWRAGVSQLAVSWMMVCVYAIVSFCLFLALVAATPAVMLLLSLGLLLLARVLYKHVKKSIDRAAENSKELAKRETSATLNAMQGVREVLIYRQQPVFYSKFRELCLEGERDRAFLKVAPAIPSSVLEPLGFCIIPASIAVMFFVYDASMTRIAGALAMIMLVCWRVLPMLNRVLNQLVGMRAVRATAVDCLERLEKTRLEPLPPEVEPEPGFELRESISLQNVSFSYPDASGPSLRALSFSIERGARVGVIGRSGAGKSTLALILSGLVAPGEGAFLVDGLPLSPAGRAAYALRVGYVPQSPYIMAGTLAENVAFSRWGKPCDEERVRRACRMAALEQAETHPDGVNMRIGERGSGLSGGQAQRLSIARALYADPAVLILDEATSALDYGVEKAVMSTIFSLPKGITTITIAHRLTTVERCESLIWIDAGAVRRIGSPETVLPEYKSFLESVHQ
ncbi:MAG: ABC transporter ATP-binding protein/permease [Desulfovibrio sp.]|jgi:ABC-type multidrug transport system fused ATPase/permease subunit|nr:ABC transporter ATP-binding protein/permease [Desulfovibrio sp.]